MPRANLEVVERVIREAGKPLRVPEIIKLAGDRLPTKSKSPRNVVYRDLAIDVRDNPKSKFVRLEPGLYSLRAVVSSEHEPCNKTHCKICLLLYPALKKEACV